MWCCDEESCHGRNNYISSVFLIIIILKISVIGFSWKMISVDKDIFTLLQDCVLNVQSFCKVNIFSTYLCIVIVCM